jgi:hypothetical protein
MIPPVAEELDDPRQAHNPRNFMIVLTGPVVSKDVGFFKRWSAPQLFDLEPSLGAIWHADFRYV